MPRVRLGMSGRESILASSTILTGSMQKQDKSLNIKSINILLIENYDEKDKSISYI